MKKNLFLAALAIVALASCSDDNFMGDSSPTNPDDNGIAAINFGLNVQSTTRGGEFIGATAAEKLGNMFVVEGTKGNEEDDSPSKTVVFDNYLVGYNANTAATTESNTNNWEYVGKENGITNRMTNGTWSSLHSGTGQAKVQSIKYWDYTASQYDFIAWSTGTCEAIPVADGAPANGKIEVSRIATGAGLSSSGFTMEAARAEDLMQCYYTDIKTVTKESGDYKKPVTLTFRNMAAKVRIGLYETVPGYSVKAVEFYQDEATAITANISSNEATLFTPTGEGNKLPTSGTVTVLYPRIGKTVRDTNPQPKDYNKASVTVTPGSATSTTQTFGALTNQYRDETGNEPDGKYLGITLPSATFAGDATKSFYTAVFPNTNGKPLTLRVNYTLVSTDGSAEEIHVYGAKAVVPATYTKWLPNYAYTYIFKISDNTNGWTSQVTTDPQGLFPITFDAMVTSFVDANAEQTTVTTVATPSITTYQQGHTNATNEYSKSKKAGADATNYKDLYVQVMDNSTSTPSLIGTLSDANSLLYAVSKANASEAEVMDALQNRTNTPTGEPAAAYKADDPVGRNNITLTKNGNIANNVDKIINGVDDQPIGITAGQAAKIDIDQLATGTYAYVYCSTVPSEEKAVYNVATATSENYGQYYEVSLSNSETTLTADDATAGVGKVYFVKNVDAQGNFVSYTFKQTKIGENVKGLVEKAIPASKATAYHTHSQSTDPYYFYFDVYNQNNGVYAVKVIKVVN